ncbi:MAG: hypothetical protein FJ388_09030, partial [Verrucomicrobia bacterium]|nr:hypothetical protein [Verrucomicrobiota bacterium]
MKKIRLTMGLTVVCVGAVAAQAAAPGLVVRPDQPNAITFPAQEAKFVRFVIQASSGGQACVDELEICGADGKRNLALAKDGAKASASSCLSGHAIHKIEHLNDGLYGNGHSWIAATTGEEWAQIELPTPTQVSKIIFSRDREGRYRDRVPVAFEVRLSLDGKQWKTVSKAKATNLAAARPAPPYVPPAPLPEPVTYDGLVRYAFLCERATWKKMDANDHLSPLQKERPALPDGEPYWGRIARLSETERVLTQMEEMIARLAAKGVAVAEERKQLAELRRRAANCSGGLRPPSAASPEAGGHRPPLQDDDESLYLDARLAKRRLMFRDPDLAPLQRILFVKRHPYLSSHNYSDVLDSQFKPGGGVCVLEVPQRAGHLEPAKAKLVTLFDASGGIARDPMADFEARKIYFAYRPDKAKTDGAEPYWHLMAVNADGRGLKQLTDGPFHDYYPCPLPDGGLAFISTRCKARFLCWRPQAFVLFRMDGGEIRPLSFANLSEWSPAMMNDGRILWTRSEYIDKGADFGHTLWAVRPDGTHPELIFGNNTPNCYLNGHEVPGTREILCTLMSHGGDHNGPLGLLDLAKANGPSDTNAITNITPDTRPHYNMSWPRHECWRDPVPVTRDYFIASHAPADRFGLYVADRWGNRELIYLDPAMGSMSPSPLRPRSRPPVLAPDQPQLANSNLGEFTVADVYEGLEPQVARGRVKYIRVCQEVRADLEQLANGEYRRDHGPVFADFYATPIHKVSGPFGWPSYVAKTSLGLVPVEADGSASFYVPAGKVVYFQ